MRTPTLLALCLPAATCAAQTGVLSGAVRDAAGGAPLPGATVQVIAADTSFGTATDTRGMFRFEALPVGVHRVRASFVGYSVAELQEVWVRAGKEENVELLLAQQPVTLGAAEVEVRVVRIEPIGTHKLTVEQALRYPATFYDPARLALYHPGTASINDQANHFSVRGNSPSANTWQLEGAEIVTPNHLTNAGTASDEPTLSGGGTTVLSAQMLGTSRLILGGAGAAYGNALGGIMDLSLRPGMSKRRGYTIQAGLLGVDLSAEGPFCDSSRASYLVNYRYSTLGLLGAMGVELGDEAITFQDLSFHVAVPLGQRSQMSVFGMGGNSSNRFAAKDSAEQEFDKDSRDIDYEALMGAAGITWRTPVGKRAQWRTTVAYSTNEQERYDKGTFYLDRNIVGEIDALAVLEETKLSAVSSIGGALSDRSTFNAGASLLRRTVRKDNLFRETSETVLTRPYLQVQTALNTHWSFISGVAFSHDAMSSSQTWEPRLAIRWIGAEGTLIEAHAGQRSQLPPVQSYAVEALAPAISNPRIGLQRMQELVLAVHYPLTEWMAAHAEAYVQQRDDVPVGASGLYSGDPLAAQSLVNAWDAQYLAQLVATGAARTVGGELSLSRSMHRGFWWMLNATFIDAEYTDAEGRTHPSRWSTGASGNALIGIERGKALEEGQRTWGFNMRAGLTGGQRYTPFIPVDGSFAPYGAQNAAAYRIDVRVYRKRELKQRTGMWSLDLLNATNAQNEAFRYYDERKGEVVVKYQLGIIPNIGYRIEF